MPSRRDFLKSACGVAALALGPALLAPEAMAADGIVRKPNGQVVVTPRQVPALAKVGGSVNLGSVKGVPTALVRTGARTYVAIDLRCTHQGVPVARKGDQWVCPLHNSRFTPAGGFVSGPAGAPLRTLPAKVTGATVTVG
jgi:Rieske Fe-S protein